MLAKHGRTRANSGKHDQTLAKCEPDGDPSVAHILVVCCNPSDVAARRSGPRPKWKSAAGVRQAASFSSAASAGAMTTRVHAPGVDQSTAPRPLRAGAASQRSLGGTCFTSLRHCRSAPVAWTPVGVLRSACPVRCLARGCTSAMGCGRRLAAYARAWGSSPSGRAPIP